MAAIKKPKLRAAAKRTVGGFQKREIALLNWFEDHDVKELTRRCWAVLRR